MICSSSRGGSSISTEWLRQHTGLLHLRAEINPLLHMAKLVYPYANTSDALGREHGAATQQKILWQQLALDVGSYQRTALFAEDWARFGADLHARLQWQWPLLQIAEGAVKESLQQTRAEQMLGTSIPSITAFHCVFLRHLRQHYPSIDPRWYDIDSQSLAHYFPQLGPLHSPSIIIEEPPFVLLSPWKRASVEELETKPLVIKTPSNAYRIPFFRHFFSKQRLKILHLKRKAEHAINGLMDGWMYTRGFHAHWIDTVAVQHPSIPPKLWKYDLPPRWQDFQVATLPNICAFQWCSAHRHTFENKKEADQYHALWFSSLLKNDTDVVEHLWRWLGVDSQPIQPIHQLPLVMATCPPRAQRWFEKKEIIAQRCAQEDIVACMERLHEKE